jgi:nucleoside-diphosphate-sugar epimerase
MKILLTGASGFIGQFLKPKLEKLGNVYELQSDLTNHKAVQQEVESIIPNIVVHLAARTEVEQSFYEQTKFSEINYVGTINLIEACAKLKDKPFFAFASTMEVYGWQPISDEIAQTGTYTNKIAFNENTQPNPNAPYAVAKYGCEKYLEYAKRAYDLDFVSLRQTNTYGRTDNNFFVTESIISQMLAGSSINLGYKNPYRNFIYISDLIDAWVAVIEHKDKVSGETLTVGPNMPIKIEDYADIIAKEIGWAGEINWNTRPKRIGEIFWLNSDHKKITKLTGWAPKVSIIDGLQRTIEQIRI